MGQNENLSCKNENNVTNTFPQVTDVIKERIS